MIEYTHFKSDPKCSGRAIVCAAYECLRCHKLHLKAQSQYSVMPWICVALKLKKLAEDPMPLCSREADINLAHKAENVYTGNRV